MSKLMLKMMLLVVCVNGASTGATSIQPKIIGGGNADAALVPWMAQIINKDGFFCAGSLIAKDWVLTAAQCVFDEKSQNLQVIINRPNLKSRQGETIAVASVVVHPQFNRNTLENDIALLKLSQPSAITPVDTLPNFSSQDQDGKMAVALGWGTTSATRYIFPTDLQQVALPITSNAICSKALVGIADSMVCAGFPAGGADACGGDSGGPLMVFDEESQTWRQAGITSFGESVCAAPGFYGVYTRVDRFNDFISSTICSPEAIPATPTLDIATNGTQVTVAWSQSEKASGYRLYYAPYPAMNPIGSLDLKQNTQLAVNLPLGSAFYVAVQAYNGQCLSGYSNIGQFVLQ